MNMTAVMELSMLGKLFIANVTFGASLVFSGIVTAMDHSCLCAT